MFKSANLKMAALMLPSLFLCGCGGNAVDKVKGIWNDPAGYLFSLFTQFVDIAIGLLTPEHWWQWPLIIGVGFLFTMSALRKYAHLVAYWYIDLFWWLIFFPWLLSKIPFPPFPLLKAPIGLYKKAMDINLGKSGWTVRQATFGLVGCACLASMFNGRANNPDASVWWMVAFIVIGIIGIGAAIGFTIEKLKLGDKKKMQGALKAAGKSKMLNLWLMFRHGKKIDVDGVEYRRCPKCKGWYNAEDAVCEHCGYVNDDAPWDCERCGEKDISAKKKRCKKGHRKPRVDVTQCTCGAWNRVDSATCDECGTPLGAPAQPASQPGAQPTEVCEYCNTVNPVGFERCINCGAYRTQPPSQPAPRAPSTPGRRPRGRLRGKSFNR